MATLRGLIRAGNDIARLGFDRPGETVELVDRAEAIVFDLSQQRVSTEFAHIDELLKESFETITKLYEAGSDITGTASGFRDLDRLTSGFQAGNLVIVAGRPSMGKSASRCAWRRMSPSVTTHPLRFYARDVEGRSHAAAHVLGRKVESQRLRTGKSPSTTGRG
jgi:replicative DNA helicase